MVVRILQIVVLTKNGSILYNQTITTNLPYSYVGETHGGRKGRRPTLLPFSLNVKTIGFISDWTPPLRIKPENPRLNKEIDNQNTTGPNLKFQPDKCTNAVPLGLPLSFYFCPNYFRSAEDGHPILSV